MDLFASRLKKDYSRRLKEKRFCRVCNEEVVEGVHHFMFECNALKKAREALNMMDDELFSTAAAAAVASSATVDNDCNVDELIFCSLGEPKKGEDHLLSKLYELWKRRCTIFFSANSSCTTTSPIPSKTVVNRDENSDLDDPCSVYAQSVVRRTSGLDE